MEFNYELVGTGWAAARIACDGETADLTASYLSDALGDLLLAAWTLTEGDTDARCSWDEEPGEYRWLLHREDGHVDVRVLWFDELWGHQPDDQGRTVFHARPTLRSLLHALATGAGAVHQRHGTDGYRDKWVDHDFPADTLTAIQRWLDQPTSAT